MSKQWMAALAVFLATASFGQMVTGRDMPGFRESFGLQNKDQANEYSVQELAVRAGATSSANILWPGETAEFTFLLTNKRQSPLHVKGRLEVIRYGTSVPLGEVWVPHVFKIGDAGSTPIEVNLPPSGSEEVTVRPTIPAKFGGYALVFDLGSHGREFAASLVRTLKPDSGRVQFPTYALDTTWDEFMNEGVFTLFEKLGVKGMRMGGAYNPRDDPERAKSMAVLDRYLQWAQRHDVTVMLTLGAGNSMKDQALGRPRPWLSPENKMLDTKDDRAWLPSYDKDFQDWVEQVASRYGWPKGNVNAMELWNEPWEGISISGWGADIPRYREIFTHMALGIEAARQQAAVKVLIGGTCSSSNARDKLFSDGSDQFLKWLDFISIHYQALAADPSEVPEWINRKSPYGPVRVWDTESWIANSEDRVAGVIASMRAQGQSRTAGVFDGNVYDSRNIKVGNSIYPVVEAWSPAAAVAASQKFIGQRAFRELLFQHGLPWVFVFDGLPVQSIPGTVKHDDGTVVIVGDLAKIYDPERTLFRSIRVAPDAHMTIANPEGTFHLYDFYGNDVSQRGGDISVPLNGRGYFLRSDGKPGTFTRLLEAVRNAGIEGYDPVEIVAHDLTASLNENSTLKLTVANILNRPISGSLKATFTDVALDPLPIVLAAHEVREMEIPLGSIRAVPSNQYSLSVDFDAGRDGKALRNELLHVNLLSRRTIKVDGDLADWDGILPQILPGANINAGITEEAWLPFKRFSKSAVNGSATAYLAYDDNNFYFAAKIADTTPDPGMVRFATRDDDSYFYPQGTLSKDGEALEWPQGVRNYSYRKNFDIPSGTSEHDNVQIAFNVLDKKPWLPNPPGVPPHFITYWDTDYEFVLNPVASQYGGSTEIWRLQAPGMPHKHFFPRQPKSPVDGGAVGDGKLVIHRDGDTRIVEASIPWSEMPEVYARIKAGTSIKFTCRVNDNKGPAHELAAGRSVSKYNSMTFHDDWQDHWANELEFGAEK